MKPKNFDIKKNFELVQENKGLLAVAILIVGALPIFIYDLSVGDLPDFTLADMTGALISSFLVGMFISLAMTGYLLFAGLATRKAVTGFYANDKEGFDKDAVHLFRGKFIVGVTLLVIIVWAGIIFEPFDHWFAPTTRGYAGFAYNLALWSCVALVFFDWRKRGRVVKYFLSGLLGGAIAFLAVLYVAYWAGFVDIPGRTGESTAAVQVAWAQSAVFTFIVEQGRSLLSGESVKLTAIFASVATAIVTIVLGLTSRGRREATLAGQKPKPIFKNANVRLFTAKLTATVAFFFLSAIGTLFLLVIVEAAPGSTQAYVTFLGACMVIMLNWAAFASSGWRSRVWLAFATFAVVFVFLPLQGRNALMLPKMVVNVLGFGNRHASTVSLSPASCALFVPYGADCKGTKEAVVNVMNVNILERLGSNIMLELLVERSGPRAGAKHNRSQKGAKGTRAVAATGGSADHMGEVLWLPKLQPAASSQSNVVFSSGCDPLLLDKLSAQDQARSARLVCVKISVPKNAIVGRTVDGLATYEGAFTSYLKVPS